MTTTESREYERDFKGVWIPREIYLNTELSWTEKIILMEIDSLDNEEGCFATNSYFAEFLDLSETTVSKSISKLKKLGFIKSNSFNGRTRVLKSSLEVNGEADLNFTSSQPLTKLQSSYISNNNTNNIKKESLVKNLKADFHTEQACTQNQSETKQEPSEYDKLKSEHQSNQIPIARHSSKNWQHVHSEFIKYFGRTAYTNWFGDKVILIKESKEEIIMQGQTSFLCEYINRNYMNGIKRDGKWLRKGIREFWDDKYTKIPKNQIRLLTESQILELKLKQSGDK